MNQDDDLLSKEAACSLLELIAPGSSLAAIRPIGDEFANATYLIEARSAAGSEIRFVLKRYIEFYGDRAEKARLEYKTLSILQEHHVPAPQPLYLDEVGSLLGAPFIVTRYIPGEQFLSSSDPLNCARELARTLAKIHSIPCDAFAGDFLLDANTETLWFLNFEGMPDYMRAHPDGPVVWQAVHELLPDLQPVRPTLVHIDYWMGNVLWEGKQIVAVLDWEEAGCGDPAIDVAYCRMDMFLSGMGRMAADEFLKVYEAEMGRRVANLELWEFAAAPRPMHDPEWKPIVRQELREFIADTRRRAGWGD